jgi:hypothetical protein
MCLDKLHPQKAYNALLQTPSAQNAYVVFKRVRLDGQSQTAAELNEALNDFQLAYKQSCAKLIGVELTRLKPTFNARVYCSPYKYVSEIGDPPSASHSATPSCFMSHMLDLDPRSTLLSESH